MLDDRHLRTTLDTQFGTLDAIPGISHGTLVGALGIAQALQADVEAGSVHHDEHVLQAAILLADQGADGTAVVAEGQHRRRAAVDAELVLDRYAIHVVALARRAVGLEQELGHDEQGNPLDTFRCIRCPGQHEMDNVVRHVVLTPGDENLLAENPVGAITDRLGATAHGSQVGAGTRLGQVHGAGPFAGNQVGQVGRLLLLGAGNGQRLDRPLGEHRTQREGVIGGLPHFADRRRHHFRQTLAAEVRFTTETVPAVVDKLAIGFLEPRRRSHLLVVPFGTIGVANAVERRQHLASELGRLLQDGIDHIGRGFLTSRQGHDLIQASQILHGKTDIF